MKKITNPTDVGASLMKSIDLMYIYKFTIRLLIKNK